MLDKLRALLKLWDLEKQAVKEIKMGNEIKPGWKTSEFWLSLLAQVPAIVGLFLGTSNPAVIAVGAAVNIAFILGRSHVKAKIGMAAAMAAVQAAADAAKVEEEKELKLNPPPAK